MRAVACVFLVACGGGSSEVEGDPLIASSLTAQFNNSAWTPVYGFGRTETANFAIYIGEDKISCADTFKGKPREGDFAATGVPAPLATGNFPTALFQMVEVVGGAVSMQSATGSVMITNVSETEVSAVLGFSTTISGGQYSLTGAVTFLRCP